MINILAHRGNWNVEITKNSLKALNLSVQNGFGIETDLRDHNGKIVISHDMPNDSNILFEDFLADYKVKLLDQNKEVYLALNIKSDGLYIELKKLLNNFKVTKYFVFDMSIPDTFGYLTEEIDFFLRHSDFEEPHKNFKKYSGIWVDCFEREWFTPEDIKAYTNSNKKVCFVSPELHNRPYKKCWNMIKCYLETLDSADTKNIMICTDKPFEAKDFFNAV